MSFSQWLLRDPFLQGFQRPIYVQRQCVYNLAHLLCEWMKFAHILRQVRYSQSSET